MAAIGFTIAFAWRNAIFNTFLDYISRFLNLPIEHFLSEIYAALAITFTGVILIFLSSRLLKE